MSARPLPRLRHATTAALALALPLAVIVAAANAPDATADAAAGSGNTPWLSPGMRLTTPAAFGARWSTGWSTGEVRWQRQDESSQWFARISMGPLPGADTLGERADASVMTTMLAPLPAPSLQGEAQWQYRGWEGHDVRLGAQARHELLLPQAQASALGAYLQDEWALGADWRAAIGLRADGAPSAETALTPRAALAWQPRPGLQLKWVEGMTWRDPNLSPLPWQGAVTTSVAAGGVRLRASEFAIAWQATPALRLAGSLHRQRDAEAVTAVAPGFVSASALRFAHFAPAAAGEGVGVEGDYGIEGWRLRARWSAFDGGEVEAGATARVFAALQAQVPLPWRGASAGFEWLRLDQRQAPPGAAALTQTLLNATLAWAPAGSPWSLAANAYNLADHVLGDMPGTLATQDVLLREGRRWQVQVARAF